MKRFFAIITAAFMMFAFAGCGAQNNNSETQSETVTATSSSATATNSVQSTAVNNNSLIVYFSHSGNTEKIAEKIRQETGGALFEIVPEAPYSSDYNTVLDEAQNEQNENARPKIKDSLDGIENYDTVYIGYPIWWGDVPMIIYSFLDEYDLSGKTIMPFCTHGGSGLSGTDKSIADEEADADVKPGLAIADSSLDSSDDAIRQWINENS